MRLFIAINFNSETRSQLGEYLQKLYSQSESGIFVMPDNLHLTLVFLGECDLTQLTAAQTAMNCITFDPFDLVIDRLGRFKRNNGDVWWAGISENKALSDLQNDLLKRLKNEGFILDSRKYTPHITLGRKVKTGLQPQQIDRIGQKVSLIDLMKSEHVDGVLTYTSIHRRGKWLNPIIIEPYNPEWAEQFDKIKSYLYPHLKDLIVDIHHVGSTSVAGLSAKAIIDFDIEIDSMDKFTALKERLKQLGYKHEGDYGITGREVFKRETAEDNEFMPYHMYVCPSNSIEFKQHLRFRDALRKDLTLAKEYAQLKTALAEKCGNDIDSYIDGKAGFIRSVLGCQDQGRCQEL